MTSSTLACLMPSSSLLKAASTPSEPGVFGAVVFFGVGFGVGVAGVWVSVATGLVRLVFVRGRWAEVLDEFEFCAHTTPHVKANTKSKLIPLSIGKLLYQGMPLRSRWTEAS